MRVKHNDLPALRADPDWRIGIVHSTYYSEEILSMVQTAEKTLMAAGIPAANISRHPAPGSFEIPLIGSALAKSDSVDAMMAFGIIVQGETDHGRLIAESVTQGIMQIQVDHVLPFAFEILYVPNIELARARALGDGNKGEEAARAVLLSLAELHRILEASIEQ